MRLLNLFKKKVKPYQVLTRNPPLIDPCRKLAVFWTPKAGCTFITKWFFSQAGLLDEALQYHPFVHKYRIQVYQQSRAHSKGVKDFLRHPGRYKIIKIVRDPYQRAVSSYLHTNKHSYADAALAACLRREINAAHRFSFREFLHFLAGVDIHDCNPHYKAQVHHLELTKGIVPDYILNLENAVGELAGLERDLDLHNTGVEKLVASGHHTIRRPWSGFAGDRVFNMATGLAVPEADAFYNPELRQQVAYVYREDFRRYGGAF
ncbi:MAG: sulfotransferase family protein [Desulfobacterales bacterium]|nr:sulfotransferase family protein [Desulfobacterales bacterium]